MDTYLKLNANCVISKGYTRSLLIDCSRKKHWFIPNDWADLLTKATLYKAEHLNTELHHYSKEEIDTFLLFLKKEGILEESKFYKIFPSPKISTTFIDCLSIEIKPKSHKVNINAINELGVNKIRLISDNIQELERNLIHYKNVNNSTIHFVIPYRLAKKSNINLLAERTKHVKKIEIENSHFNDERTVNNVLIKFFRSSNKKYRLDYYSDPNTFHKYYNKRLFITAEGNVKNAQNTDFIFGNIQKTTLKTILSKSNIKQLWQVEKKVIDVCQDCEFNAICLDHRNLVKRKNNTWYSTEECFYNPYIAKNATDQNYLRLNDCGIWSTKQGFKVEVEMFMRVLREVVTSPNQLHIL